MLTVFLIAFISLLHPEAKPAKTLDACWKKQVKPFESQYLAFSFQGTSQQLEHNFKPWQPSKFQSAGNIWVNAAAFQKRDSLLRLGSKHYSGSKEVLTQTALLYQDDGDTALSGITKSDFEDEIVQVAAYSPLPLIAYFKNAGVQQAQTTKDGLAQFKTTINESIVTLCINQSNQLVERIECLSNSDLYGDVLTVYNYNHYAQIGGAFYPDEIKVSKTNGHLEDDFHISFAHVLKDTFPLLQKPAGYAFKEEKKTETSVSTEKYSDNIYFISLKHTDDRVMLVEFKDYFLAAEAPLNSGNGELILQEAHKIAPGKPVKYFVFGHFHPHYLGGMRAFVHKGATVLCTKSDTDYVKCLATAPHTLKPDSLQLQPKPLNMALIDSVKTISDGSEEMRIYWIGKQSAHTVDYLFYYFPKEKLVFEDDLIWVPAKGDLVKANVRQKGIYDAIRARNLDVQTVIQSWPVSNYGAKTVIPFSDLQKSVEMK
jgi:hypothetical protein